MERIQGLPPRPHPHFKYVQIVQRPIPQRLIIFEKNSKENYDAQYGINNYFVGNMIIGIQRRS